MDIINRRDVEVLSQHTGEGPYVSLYLPTDRLGGDSKQGAIRLKNLVAEAEEQLTARGVRPQERKKLLELPRRLVDDSMFWSYMSDGLALFLSLASAHYYRLPIHFHQLVEVADSFNIKPLLPLLVGDGKFFILAISQKEARLLLGTRDTVEVIPLGKEIEQFEQETEEQFPEKNIQFHTGTPRQGGGRPAIFFSQGGEIDHVMQDKLLRYFRLIDRKLHDQFEDESLPVILASVDALVPLYKEASQYSQLVEEGITGNPDKSSIKELHQKAWEIMELYFAKRKDEAKMRYLEQKGTGRSTANLNEIIPAAYHGRVDTLFVTGGIQRWGSFDLEDNTLTKVTEPAQNTKDLLALAAVQTFLKNGTVYILDVADMPDAEPVVALLRY
ncbi:MAG: hypothetical protein NUK65_11525 [Firmicutes bacterium]|nr:hypothetical protein [Bacillota bacterium]